MLWSQWVHTDAHQPLACPFSIDIPPSPPFLYPMQIIDLTENYSRDFIQGGDRQAYENSFPELFEHYYHYWTKRELAIARVNNEDINTRKAWIKKLIEKLKPALAEHGLDMDSPVLVYFIGVGTTNGHAFRHNDKLYVWLPLETYTSQKLVDIFVTHEIAHALHYQHSPEFYTDDIDDKLQTGRQLITEGLATYATQKLLGVPSLKALWADYLSEDDARKWLQTCEAERRDLYRLLADNYCLSNPDIKIFYADNPENIYEYRSGYYAGLKLIEKYAEITGLSLKDLLKLTRPGFDNDILDLLRSEI